MATYRGTIQANNSQLAVSYVDQPVNQTCIYWMMQDLQTLLTLEFYELTPFLLILIWDELQ